MAIVLGPSSVPEPSATMSEGKLVARRYRVLDRTTVGWLAYDERLSRTVLLSAISGDGLPAERVRREASAGGGLLDAVVVGDEAFAVRPTNVSERG